MFNIFKKMMVMAIAILTILFGFTAPAMATEYVYELTDQLTAGGEYLIVNSNTTGSSKYALGHNGGSDTRDEVTVSSNGTVASYYYIEETDVEGTSKWIVAGNNNNGYTFKCVNDNYYVSALGLMGIDDIEMVTNNPKSWKWNSTDHQLSTTVGITSYTVYLTYSNSSFTTVTNNKSVYLYKKVLKKVIFSATPENLTFNCDLSQSDAKTITVNGSYLRGNVTWELEDPNGVFTINPSSLTPTNRTITNGTFTVTFHPTALGTYNGTVTLKTEDANSIVVNLKGTVNIPELSANPSPLSFNCVIPNTDSKTITVNGTHLGGNVSVTLNDQNGVFSVSPTPLTPNNGTITNGTITVTFNPQERGDHTYTGTVTLSSTSVNPVVITLNATATDVWIDVTITDAGVATFYYDLNVLIPYSTNGLTDVWYPHEIVNNSSLNFTRIPNNIPAKTPVILEGKQGTYRFYRNNGTVTALTKTNLLSGSLTDTNCATVLAAAQNAGKCGPNAYVMTIGHEVKTNEIGFHRYLGSALGSHKAFLIYDPGTTNNNVSFLSINRDDENTDGIRDVRALNSDDAWYTLQGARLSGKPSQRGIYIHGGKKVTLK